MSGSILVLIGRIAYMSYDSSFRVFLETPSTLFTILSFILFFGRFFWGDSNFNEILNHLGINTIFHSKNFLLRNKRIIDSIILSVQGSFFLLLAYFTHRPNIFFIIFYLILNINICWLLFQNFCFRSYLTCIKEKFRLRLKGYDEFIYLQKYEHVDRMISISNIWLYNNVFFSVSALICFIAFYNVNSDSFLLNIALWLSIANSGIDIFMTGNFYSRPENFLLEKKN